MPSDENDLANAMFDALQATHATEMLSKKDCPVHLAKMACLRAKATADFAAHEAKRRENARMWALTEFGDEIPRAIEDGYLRHAAE